MWKLIKPEVAGLIRHLLTTAGGSLMANGWLTASDVDMIAGAIATLVGVAWSILHKRYVKRFTG